MSQTLSTFSQDDVKQHKILEDLLSKKATWDLTTAESIQLYRSLVWFAQLSGKLEKSIMEVVSVKKTEPQRVPGKKATRDAQAAMAGK